MPEDGAADLRGGRPLDADLRWRGGGGGGRGGHHAAARGGLRWHGARGGRRRGRRGGGASRRGGRRGALRRRRGHTRRVNAARRWSRPAPGELCARSSVGKIVSCTLPYANEFQMFTRTASYIFSFVLLNAHPYTFFHAECLCPSPGVDRRHSSPRSRASPLPVPRRAAARRRVRSLSLDGASRTRVRDKAVKKTQISQFRTQKHTRDTWRGS